MKILFSRDIFFLIVFFVIGIVPAGVVADQPSVSVNNSDARKIQQKKNFDIKANANAKNINISIDVKKQEAKINTIIDNLEKTLPPIRFELKLNEEYIAENKDGPLVESYAGMVGDKRASKGLTLDLTMETRGAGYWLLCVNGKEIENVKLVHSYLKINPSRFLIDVNTNLLQDKVVNFTYQMPRDIRLKYGQQLNGYRIAIDLPIGTKIANKKVSKGEISVKFINQDIVDEYEKKRLEEEKLRRIEIVGKKSNNDTKSGGAPNFSYLDSGTYGMRKITKDAVFKKIKLDHKRRLTVAIDAGHGGIDPGAKSKKGVYEKNITLMYAKGLEKELKRLGINVVMTRDDDKTIALTNRVKIAKQAKADLFVSLHTDAHDDSKISGTTVYRLSYINGNHPDWERFYNKNYLPKQYESYVNNRSILDILVGMTHRTLIEKSSIIVDNTLLTFQKDNICKRCRYGQRSFAVLRGLDMLSMLIEIGYITNPSEEKKILLASNVEKFSKSLANAIVKTFEI